MVGGHMTVPGETVQWQAVKTYSDILYEKADYRLPEDLAIVPLLALVALWAVPIIVTVIPLLSATRP